MPRGYEAHEAMVADVKRWVKMGVLALLVCLVVQAVIVALVARNAYREQFTVVTRPGVTTTLPFSVLWKYYLPSFVLFGRESRVTPPAEVRALFPGKTTVPVSEYRRGLERRLGGRIAAFEAAFRAAIRWSFLVYLLAMVYITFFLRRSRKLSGERFLRGATKVPFETLQAGLKKTVDADIRDGSHRGLRGRPVSAGGFPHGFVQPPRHPADRISGHGLPGVSDHGSRLGGIFSLGRIP